MTRGQHNWKTALGLSAMLAILILFSGSVPPMDDTYIHLVYGRSLFSSSPLSFNPGEPSSGFSSPLWLVPSALASLTGSGLGPSVLMLASVVAAAAAVIASGSASLLLLSGPLLFHGGSGMETALACLFTALVWRSMKDRSLERWAPLILAGAFLTRPELAVLGLPLLLIRIRRGLMQTVILVLPLLVAAALWVLWNLRATGMPLPGTFYAKQAVPWTEMLRIGAPNLLRNMAITSPLLLPAALIAVISAIRRKSIRWTIPVLLGTAALATQPNSWFQMRYWVPFIFACGLVVSDWLDIPGRWKWHMRILLVSTLIPGMAVFALRRVRASVDVGVIDRDPACLLECVSSPGETVAAADIGAVGWLTDLRVLDLDGLISPETLPGSFPSEAVRWDYVSERADYLLAFPVQYAGLTEAAGSSLQEIHAFNSPAPVICGEESVILWRILPGHP